MEIHQDQTTSKIELVDDDGSQMSERSGGWLVEVASRRALLFLISLEVIFCPCVPRSARELPSSVFWFQFCFSPKTSGFQTLLAVKPTHSMSAILTLFWVAGLLGFS